MGREKKSEEREGGRHAMAKGAPARKAPQNGFFPFSERMENSHWLRGSRGNAPVSPFMRLLRRLKYFVQNWVFEHDLPDII